MRTLSGGSGGTPGFQSSSPSSSHSPGFINITGCANSRERPESEQLKQDKHNQRGKGLIIIICKSLRRARASVRPPVCTVTSIYQHLPDLFSVENSWPQNLSKICFFLPQKFCGNSAKLWRKSFIISVGVQGCLLFVFLLRYKYLCKTIVKSMSYTTESIACM